MSFPRTWLIVPIVAGICLLQEAGAQFPFGGPRGDGGGGSMAELMERVAMGRVEDVNPIQGYIQVGGSRRGSRIVVVSEATEFTRLGEVPLSEVRVGDEVSITGVPTAIRAETVLLSQPLSMADVLQALQQGDAAADQVTGSRGSDEPETSDADGADEIKTDTPVVEDQEEPEPEAADAAEAQGSGFGAPASLLSTTVSGVVKSVEPFVVELRDGLQISVAMPADAHAFRRQGADISAAEIGAQVLAVGQVNDDGYLAADRVLLGETISMGMGRSGRGPGPGGPPGGFGGGPGGRGGGFGGPPTPPSEEEQSG